MCVRLIIVLNGLLTLDSNKLAKINTNTSKLISKIESTQISIFDIYNNIPYPPCL
jgi:hypothetical protein